MLAVIVEITRIVDWSSYPGCVECRLTDASGREWLFIEKIPIVTADHVVPDSCFPLPGVIACEVVATKRDDLGREVLTVDTGPWQIESTNGVTHFDVLRAELTEFAHCSDEQ
jgi:hypothetical protein